MLDQIQHFVIDDEEETRNEKKRDFMYQLNVFLQILTMPFFPPFAFSSFSIRSHEIDVILM